MKALTRRLIVNKKCEDSDEHDSLLQMLDRTKLLSKLGKPQYEKLNWDYLELGAPTDYTPLHLAVLSRKGNFDKLILYEIRSLLHSRADVNCRNKKQDTPLHHAIAYGDIQVAKLLIAYNADVNALGNSGSTPLLEAVKNKYTDISVVELLLGLRADIDVQTKQGWSVLYFASNRRPDLVKLLEEAGATYMMPKASYVKEFTQEFMPSFYQKCLTSHQQRESSTKLDTETIDLTGSTENYDSDSSF